MPQQFFFFFLSFFILYIYVHRKCPTVFRKTEKLKKREGEGEIMDGMSVLCQKKWKQDSEERER